MELFAVIMAGGVGSRFWPRSKQQKPKQLIRIFGQNTMIQDTVTRLEGLVKKENILVITNQVQKDRVIEQLEDVPKENIIAEPFGKNTAACIGLASAIINKKSKNSVSIILPADHLIKDKSDFQDTIKKAVDFASNSDSLLTIGINPTRPETGYGYIQIIDKPVADNIYKVQTFAEKPNLSTAVRFVESGDFLWNSGMFIWKTETILNEISVHLPDLYEGLLKIEESMDNGNFEDTLTNVYGQLASVSIDYGIMEKSSKVYLTKGHFSWSDVGSWEEVYQLSNKDGNGNSQFGDIYTENTLDSYIFSPRKFTAIVGLENIIVIDTKDALLICNRDNAQDVKHVVDYLKMNNKDDLL
ncbi:MAG: NTP transferase domain-containing protein [Ignavibacteriales bacterium]|nr:NTP transferase domain-containing protein [Ignavibacteriales bacterium]MCB9218885.1 NTP transferase domain-containing protein [Ignavibacteriales bacterium]